MIKLQMTGRLGSDAQIQQIPSSGDNVIKFNVATDIGYGDRKKTVWVQCVYWRKADQSTALAQYLKKGTQVYVSGTPSASAWTAKDGTLNANLELSIHEVELQGGGQNQSAQQQVQATQAAPQTTARPAQAQPVNGYMRPADDEDLPF